MSMPACSGWRRLTRLGSSTFMRAIAPPASTVPGNSITAGTAARSSSPPVSSSRAASRTRSSPCLRLSGAARAENRPKHRTGVAARTATTALDRCSAAASSGKTGGRLVIDARRLTASTVMPTMSSAMPLAGGVAAGRWPASGGTSAMPDVSEWRTQRRYRCRVRGNQ
jgi:hypothetical protein